MRSIASRRLGMLPAGVLTALTLTSTLAVDADAALKGRVTSAAAAIAAVAPAKPTALKVVSVGDKRVELDWADNAAGFGRYQVYRNDKLIADGPTTSKYVDTAVVNGTAYTYRVSAGTAGRYSAWTATVSATPAAPKPVAPAAPATPAVPTGLKVASVGDGTVSLDWNDNAAGFTRYQVYRNDALIADGPTASEFKVTGLTNNTAYTFRVSAGTTGKYSAWTGTVSATPKAALAAPAAPVAATPAPASAAPAPVTPAAPSGPRPTASVFDFNSENGVFPHYGQGLKEGDGANATLGTVAAPGGIGGMATKLVMPPSRGAAANVPNRRLVDVPRFTWRSGDEYWYGVRMYFGDDWQLGDLADSRTQFTSLFSFRYLDGSRNGTGSFKITNTATGPRLRHTRASLSASDFADGGGEDPLDLGPVVKNTWINFVCHFKWNTKAGAALKECWRDGVLMGRSTKANMAVDLPVNLRVGIYQGTAVDHTRTLYWDNHRIGKSFAEVDPTR